MPPSARRRAQAIAATGILLALGTGIAAAQTGSGRLLTFGTTLGAVADDNLGLDRESAGNTLRANARFDLALLLATPLQQLSLSGDVGARAVDRPDGVGEGDVLDGLADPSLQFAYTRAVPQASLDVTGFARQANIAFLEPFDRGLDDPLILDDLDDLDARRRSGTRLSYGLDATLALRRTSPFGITLSAGTNAQRYSDVTDAELTDEDRVRAGVGFRLDLTQTTRATVNLGYSGFTDAGDTDGRRDTFSLGMGVSQQRRGGTVGVDASVVSTEDGTRLGFSLDRSVALPLGTLGFSLGATRGDSGDIYPTASLNLVRQLPDGTLTADLSQSLRSGSDDRQRRVTAVSVGYARDLTPLSSLGVNLAYLASDDTGTNATESFGSLGVDLRRTLTEDWNLNLGLRHRFEDTADDGRASGNTLSLSLRRQVTLRP
jgi:hypothetical protein